MTPETEAKSESSYSCPNTQDPNKFRGRFHGFRRVCVRPPMRFSSSPAQYTPCYQTSSWTYRPPPRLHSNQRQECDLSGSHERHRRTSPRSEEHTSELQ